MKTASSLRAFLLGLSFAGFAAAASAQVHYQPLQPVLVGGDGGWDCLEVDPAAHRLYVTHATKIVVLDTQQDVVVGEISGLVGAHDFAIDPSRGRGFASSGKENKVSMVDLAKLTTLARIPTGQNPDIMLFEPARAEIYAFNGHDSSVTVIDPATGKVTATIPLGGKPEFAQADGGRVFVNLEDKNEVAVIDVQQRAVVRRWPIAPGESATGMGIDRAHHRLFLGCDNSKLVVLDSQDGRVVATVPVGRGIDGTTFDPGTQLAFTSNGADGTVTVVHEDTPDTFTVVQTLSTEPGARTMAVDPASHKIFLPSAKFEPKAPGDTHRPKMIPGTFKVLVYELKS